MDRTQSSSEVCGRQWILYTTARHWTDYRAHLRCVVGSGYYMYIQQLDIGTEHRAHLSCVIGSGCYTEQLGIGQTDIGTEHRAHLRCVVGSGCYTE